MESQPGTYNALQIGTKAEGVDLAEMNKPERGFGNLLLSNFSDINGEVLE